MIEGQQMMWEERKEQTDPIVDDFEDEFRDESKKQGIVQEI